MNFEESICVLAGRLSLMGQCYPLTGKRLVQKKWKAVPQMVWRCESGSTNHVLICSLLIPFFSLKVELIFKLEVFLCELYFGCFEFIFGNFCELYYVSLV